MALCSRLLIHILLTLLFLYCVLEACIRCKRITNTLLHYNSSHLGDEEKAGTYFALKLLVLRCATVADSLLVLSCCRGSVAGEGGNTVTSSRDVELLEDWPDMGGSSFRDNLHVTNGNHIQKVRVRRCSKMVKVLGCGTEMLRVRIWVQFLFPPFPLTPLFS